MIDKVVSVCSARDLEVWQAAAPALLENVAARTYEVIVPDAEVPLFEAASPVPYLVVPESRYLGERDLDWFRSRLPEDLRARAGWYLQQIAKISAIVSAADDEIVLVWDADTIPIRRLQFLDAGKVVYHVGSEYNPGYFSVVNNLVGLPKLAGFSFIAQCFPTRVLWMRKMCSEIESAHDVHWADAIVAAVSRLPKSSFSEYETMGTYIYEHYRDDIVISARRWFRYGNRLLGSPKQLTGPARRLLAGQYDYISFEHWDAKNATGVDTIKNWAKWVELATRYALRA